MPKLPGPMRTAFADARSVVKYVGLKVQGECLGQVLGRLRIQCNVDMIPHIDYGSTVKTVVFTSYVDVVDALSDFLSSINYRPLVVYGKTNRELAPIITRFDQDPDINPLIATYASLSTAVPLVMADTVILMDQPFRGYIQEQAI